MALLYKFPKLYDYLEEKTDSIPEMHAVHDQYWREIETIDLKPGAMVLDLACGTGETTFWLAENRPDIHIVGVDITKPMVERSIYKAQEKGMTNVSFVHKSGLDLTLDDFPGASADHPRPLDLVICCMGYSAMKASQEAVFMNTLSFLRSGGSYVIMDAHQPKRDWKSLVAKYTIEYWLVGADQYRKPWEGMERELVDFAKYDHVINDYGFLPVTYFVAKGVKP